MSEASKDVMHYNNDWTAFLVPKCRHKDILLVSVLYWQLSWAPVPVNSSTESIGAYYTVRSQGCGCFWVSKLTKIGATNSAPSTVHLLNHCGSIFDHGGVLAPQAVPPVTIRGFFSPHPTHALLTALPPLTLAWGETVCLSMAIGSFGIHWASFLVKRTSLVLEWNDASPWMFLVSSGSSWSSVKVVWILLCSG